MVQLTFLSGAQAGRQLRLDQPVIRFGRSEDCDIQLDDPQDLMVSNHHAELVLEDGALVVIDTGSTNGTWVNGLKVVKQRLQPGDVLSLGGEQGVALKVEALDSPSPPRATKPDVHQATLAVASPLPPATVGKIPPILVPRVHATAALVAGEAALQVASERARAGGPNSGLTMDIMAAAMVKVQQSTRLHASRKWLRVVAAVGVAGLLVAGVMGAVIWKQHREINRLVSMKGALDREIEQVHRAMERETDDGRLAELEQRLAQLSGTAQTTLVQVAQQDRARAEALQNQGDELELAIKRILAKFDAKTYAIPPLFKETLRREVDLLARAGNLKYVYGRRNRHWPLITEAFGKLGLPEEMAYIAWAETQFDAEKVSPAGARGMWQMTAGTAVELGLRVDDQVDERLDVDKQTRAAARKLANLLSVFGSDSFMLAMASYNSGEFGVRRVLVQVAQEKDGFRREKRDFWHLYRMRKLPQETMDYVPRVLAAAVICGEPKRYGLEPPEAK
ncbi:MAG: FHA domain-containing protein [Holophagaceae bacterium]|uniref:FHA domain-containing protein n=1 Tax=Candidatus Geothrix skivensis TaxID=2954439 RepID=A0A9D7SJY2_9BACT|nr:FHA domain-containing protein [Candidatus Geothrix skivensis]